jgi:hypothetical protein
MPASAPSATQQAFWDVVIYDGHGPQISVLHRRFET